MSSTAESDVFSWENSEELSEIDEHLEYVDTLIEKYTWKNEYREQVRTVINTIKNRRKGGKLNVSVIGEFSTGKSSFINAFLRTELTDVQVLQGTTAAASIIEYYPEYIMIVAYRDGKKKRSKFKTYEELKESFAELTTNLEKAYEISSINVGIPEAKHLGNLRLIDTPGTNVEYEWQEEVTLKIIDKLSDCSVILIDATQVLPQSLVRFIHNHLEHILPQCVFVVTKIDCIRPKECGGMVDYIKKRISHEFGIENPVIFPYSSTLVLSKKSESDVYDMSLKNEAYIYRHVIKQRAIAQFKKLLSLTEQMYTAVTENILNIKGYVTDEKEKLIEEKKLNTHNVIAEKKESIISEYEAETGKIRKKIMSKLNAASHTAQFAMMSKIDAFIALNKMNAYIVNDIENDCKREATKILKLSENSADSLYDVSKKGMTNSYNVLKDFYKDIKKKSGGKYDDVLGSPPVLNDDILREITESGFSSDWLLPTVEIKPVEAGGPGLLGGIGNKVLNNAKNKIRPVLKMYFDDVIHLAATHIDSCISITNNYINSEFNKYIGLNNAIKKNNLKEINLKEQMYDFHTKEIESDLMGIEARLFRVESLRENLNKINI